MSRRANFGGQLTGQDSAPSSAPSPASRPPPPHLANHQQHGGGGGQGGQNNNNRNKGKGKQRNPQPQPSSQQHQQQHPSLADLNARAAALAKAADEAGETDDGAICFICAEPVQYWAVGVCSHRTCHTCSIRLRALYKKRECTFCKTDCPTVIFTDDDEKPFEEYTPEQTPFSDAKLGILCETRAQLDDTVSLLLFNCPYKPSLSDPSSAAPPAQGEEGASDAPAGPQPCDQILTGWPDLKRHVRNAHSTTLCDLCCTNKKIFAHEHELFALPSHSHDHHGGRGKGRRQESELDRHLESQHAMCGFCTRWFYDSDGLYKHCREQHEECFICVRQGIRHQYHLNYDRLEQHYKTEHYLCPHPECLAKKFVVFESEIDLQAHALSEHGVGSGGAGGLDQKARMQARRIETSFVYSNGESSRGGGGGGGGRGARQQGGGSGGRAPAASFVEPVREDPVPRGERRVPGLGPAAGPSGGRAARFGGQLTADSSPPSSEATTPRTGASTPAGAGGAAPDAQTLEKHAQLSRRVSEAVRGNEGRVTGFKIAVRSYRSGEMSSGDLVDQLFNIFDQNVDIASPIITSLADLLEDPSKRSAVLSAWRDLRLEQNQFPSLAPLAPTLNGIPTSAPGAASQHRALAAQHRGGGNPSSTWARVEQAATSSGPAPVAPRSNPFPALMSASNAKSIPGLSKAGQAPKVRPAGSGTAWSGASSSSAGPFSAAFPSLSSSSRPSSMPISAAHSPDSFSRPSSAASARSAAGSLKINRAPPRAASGLEFPSLPKLSPAEDKRARMKAAMAKPVGRTVLDSGPVPGGSVSPPTEEGEETGGLGGGNGGGGKKKGKGRQKVLLMSSGLASQTQ
ncbi:hypothetical protein JCM8547_003544 [Rhodosporidiobolus lusitaniae]